MKLTKKILDLLVIIPNENVSSGKTLPCFWRSHICPNQKNSDAVWRNRIQISQQESKLIEFIFYVFGEDIFPNGKTASYIYFPLGKRCSECAALSQMGGLDLPVLTSGSKLTTDCFRHFMKWRHSAAVK